MEIKKLSNNDLLQLIRSIILELENREYYRGLVVGPKLGKSANEQRAELIERARKFVEGKFSEGNEGVGSVVYGIDGHNKVEFVVNSRKKTVVALLHYAYEKSGVVGKGLANCNPSDVFNADIGKAIALARALDIDVPQEFMQAVQPTKNVEGMIVEDETHTGGEYILIANGQTLKKGHAHIGSPVGKDSIILDDTNAIYKEVAK